MEFDRNYYAGLVTQGRIREVMDYLAPFPNCAESLRKYQRIYEEEDYPPIGKDEGIGDILLCYQKYYRDAFYLELPEEECRERLRLRLLEHLPQADPGLPLCDLENGPLLEFVTGKGVFMHSSIIAGHINPFIWTESEQKTYQVELPEGVQECSIVFARNFIFMGWWWYLALGNYGVGAWVDETNTVYCDIHSYDKESEDFLISMLKHEAQHLMDQTRWPNLSDATMEFRAYLVELIYYQEENRLPIFMGKASLDDPNNEYALASYWICESFANHFGTDDLGSIPIPEIQAYARQMFDKTTERCMELNAV